MLEVAVWSIQPDIREMGMPDVAISPATEHALICSQKVLWSAQCSLCRLHAFLLQHGPHPCCMYKLQVGLIINNVAAHNC